DLAPVRSCAPPRAAARQPHRSPNEEYRAHHPHRVSGAERERAADHERAPGRAEHRRRPVAASCVLTENLFIGRGRLSGPTQITSEIYRSSSEERSMTEAKKVDLVAALATFTEPWSPRIVARYNDNKIFLAKAKGDFVWHSHPDTDDLFVVLEGHLTIE